MPLKMSYTIRNNKHCITLEASMHWSCTWYQQAIHLYKLAPSQWKIDVQKNVSCCLANIKGDFNNKACITKNLLQCVRRHLSIELFLNFS